MIGAALIVIVVTMLALSAGAWAACLRLGSIHTFLLCAYLVAWTELVLASLLVSAFSGLSPTGLLASSAVWVLVASSVWVRRGRPHPPSFRERFRWLEAALANQIELRILASVVFLGYAYLVALGLFTPQNDSDTLIYHLARAALWRQNGHIGVFDAAAEPRLDVNPPVADIGSAAALILAGSERFVWIVQLSAVGALAVGVFGLARRVGVDARGALLSATAVPAIPVVAMQAVSGLNDLVLAAFVVAAAVFVLGREARELVPLLLAVALAIGTKFTAPVLLPMVVLLGALGQPVRRWPIVGAFGAAGAVLGSGWYVVNLVRTGELDGGLAAFAGQEPVHTVDGISATAQLLLLRSFEVPGGDGWGMVVFVVVGLAIALAGLTERARRSYGRAVLVAGLLLAATPLAMFTMVKFLGVVFGLGWDTVGDAELAKAMRSWRPSTVADGAISWYGPLAAVLAVTLVAITTKRARAGTMSRAAVVLSLAPWIAIVTFAAAVVYDPWRGRFMAAAWMMSIALWGAVAVERRWLAVTITVVSSLTFALSLVGYFGKPMGLDAFSMVDGRSIWRQERWEAQALITRTAGERHLVREVEHRVPADDTVAVSVFWDDLLFPYFGRDLGRTVRLVDSGERVPASANWVAAAPDAAPLGCSEAWRTAFAHDTGWRLYRRRGADRCRVQTPLGSPTAILWTRG